MAPDGSYKRVPRREGEKVHNSQEILMGPLPRKLPRVTW